MWGRVTGPPSSAPLDGMFLHQHPVIAAIRERA